jgi:hypothetical protein
MEIPDLQIDAKNRIIEQTKKIPLKVNGQDAEVTIRKLDTGSRNKIRSECTKTTVLGGQPQVKVDELEIQEKILSKAIIDAPFDFTVEGIKRLPADVTDYIFEEYNNFAEPTLKKNVE